MTTSVTAIVVLYKPDLTILKRNIESIYEQVKNIIIVDNTPNTDISDWFKTYTRIEYVALNANVGIARAQNIGIKSSEKYDSELIYFLDQDSISPNDVISNLTKFYYRLRKDGINVGAVGPRPYNRDEGKTYIGSVKKGIRIDNSTTEVSELINSGSLISKQALIDTNGMDESLFIDGVDHEWCWRANKKNGYRFFIDEECLLSHKLGEGDRKFIIRKVAIPTPFRTYYQFRNYFYLVKRDYVPIYWKFSNGLKYSIKLFYYPIFISPRKSYLKNILRGIKDGIKSLF